MKNKLFLLITFIVIHTSCESHESVSKHSLLHDIYISENYELDAYLVCRSVFPLLSPEQINESIKDIRKFIETYERAGVRATLSQECKIGEFFLTNILHAYGHVITFIEQAQVNIKSKRVFVPRDNSELVTNSVPLVEYWQFVEHNKGVKLHVDKLYASCIDYLLVMIGTQLSIPCRDRDHLSEVEDRWIFWLEKVARKLEDNNLFGGYYDEYVKIFKEVFFLWKSDFEKQEKLKKRTFVSEQEDE